jgi:hypothetical protein
MVIIIIALLTICFFYQRIKINNLNNLLKIKTKERHDLYNEYIFYYDLAKKMHGIYREYDIFPSKSVREISKQIGW